MTLTDETAGAPRAGVPEPSGDAAAVYGYALRRGQLLARDPRAAAELGLTATEFSRAVHQLRALHLLRAHHRRAGALVPVDPESASASLISPIDAEVRQRRTTIEHLRERLDAFRPHYTSAGLPGAAGDQPLTEIHDAAQLTGELYRAAEECAEEYVALLPNGRLCPDTAGTGRIVPNALRMLSRGLRVRMLLQHAARSDFGARKVLDGLLDEGALVRTADQLPRQVLIFDQELAFLLPGGPPGGEGRAAPGAEPEPPGAEPEPPGAEPPLAVLIRSRSAVRLVLDLVESAWAGAHPYQREDTSYREVAGSLRHTIVQLLAEGLTDDAVARRLGISVRTCRRHIAAVLRDLDAVSRFQAGVRVGAARGAVPPGD